MDHLDAVINDSALQSNTFYFLFFQFRYPGKSTLCQVIIQELKLNSGALTLYEGNRSLAIPGKDVGKINLTYYCAVEKSYN